MSSVSLSYVTSKWFAACSLVLNLDRTKMIEFVTNNSPQSAFSIGYKANYVEDTVNKKFLVVRKITKQSARLLVIKVKK